MGGEQWTCLAKYENAIETSLQKARQYHFETYFAKRFPSIQAVVDSYEAEGTDSILDVSRLSERPAPGTSCAVSKEVLREIFGTDKPLRSMLSERFPDKFLYEVQEESYSAYRATPNPSHTKSQGFRNWWDVRGDIEDVLADVFENCRRGEAFHLVIYDDNGHDAGPAEILFGGCSYD